MGRGSIPRSRGETDPEQGVSCWERTLVLLGTSVVGRGATRSISVTRVQGRQSQEAGPRDQGTDWHLPLSPWEFCFQLRRDGLFNVYEESHG